MADGRVTGAGHDVDLGPTQRSDLEAFYWRVNTDPGLREMPLVAYPDFTRRRVQCFGAGNRLVYMDTDGRLHPCPFCRTSSRSAIGNLDDALARCVLPVVQASQSDPLAASDLPVQNQEHFLVASTRYRHIPCEAVGRLARACRPESCVNHE